MACMASHLSSNGRISDYFDNVCLKSSTHANFKVHFHSILSKCINFRNRFYDAITNELYSYGV